MVDYLYRLQFKGLPEWFRRKDYDRSPKDGRFQPAEITEPFVKDYLGLDLVGQKNVFVYADAQADDKLLFLINQKGKRPSFNPRDSLLVNEKVLPVANLNSHLGNEKEWANGFSVIPNPDRGEKELLHTKARLIFTLGDPTLPKLLDQYGALLLIATEGEETEASVSVTTIAHERAHATLNLLNDPESRELQKRAGEELKGAKEKLAALFAELETKHGIPVIPQIYKSDRQLEVLHPLVYLYGFEVTGKGERNFGDWLKQQGLENAGKVYDLLFEKTILGDPEVNYYSEHLLWTKEEWLFDSVIEEWMRERSPQERKEMLTILITGYEGDGKIHDRIWRYLERQVLMHETGAKVLSKEALEGLKGIFRYIFFTREDCPELARHLFSLLSDHPKFFPSLINRYTYFSPPRFSEEGKQTQPGFFIHDYYDYVSKSIMLGRKVVYLNWESEHRPPKTIQIMEGTPPYAPPREKEWDWSPLHSASASETEEVLNWIWYWQWNRDNMRSLRRENRSDFWWSMTGTSAGLLFGLLGGANLWQEGEMKPLPLGITIGGGALASWSGYKLWKSNQEKEFFNSVEKGLKVIFPALEPIPDLEAAKKWDTSRSLPVQVQSSGMMGK